jgi:hypothetical protein
MPCRILVTSGGSFRSDLEAEVAEQTVSDALEGSPESPVDLGLEGRIWASHVIMVTPED